MKSIMFKKSKIVVPALLSMAFMTSTAMSKQPDDPSDAVRQLRSQASIEQSRSTTAEDGYWGGFTRSGMEIHHYVKHISETDTKAATWFLCTGGKNGFAAREATKEERDVLEYALRKVIQDYSTRADKTQGVKDWAGIKQDLDYTKSYIVVLEKKVDELTAKVSVLEVDVRNLRTEVCSLKDRLIRSDEERKRAEARSEKLIEDLRAESDRRFAEIVKGKTEILETIERIQQKAEESKVSALQTQTSSADEIKQLLAAANVKLEQQIKEEKEARVLDIERIQAAAKEREVNFLKMIEKEKDESKLREEAFRQQLEAQRIQAAEQQSEFLKLMQSMQQQQIHSLTPPRAVQHRSSRADSSLRFVPLGRVLTPSSDAHSDSVSVISASGAGG